MKSAVFVNGVPASGKSTVARSVSDAGGWPLLSLDTIKEAFFNHLGTGDRDYNRLLGKASYEAIFALVADFPEDSVVVVDAWFGFQPLDVLQQHLARARIVDAVEVWCHAPSEVVASRYLGRVASRPSGHLGADYAPELKALAERAVPTGMFPVIEVETTQSHDPLLLLAEIRERLRR